VAHVRGKIQARFYHSDRYDCGLWCDALVQESDIPPSSASFESKTRLSSVDNSDFGTSLLISDSIMAVEETDQFQQTSRSTYYDLVSLNYWDLHGPGHKYWLESPLRVFNKRGLQIYNDKICSLHQIKWEKHCKLSQTQIENKKRRKTKGALWS
jgi:hypothetical protein